MRKILLATTAIVGVAFVGAAHAAAPAASPITLNVGGYNDFIGGYADEGQQLTAAGAKRADHDFEDEFKVNFDALGKGSNGLEYGANISLWNGPEVTNYFQGGQNTVELNSGYVWISGMFGKVLAGDEHGASDLFIYAPSVGEGQLDGRYQDFTSPFTLARVMQTGFDNTEHSTKLTYYTPKIGNDANKVQVGVSYIPQMYDYGSNITKFSAGGNVNNAANVLGTNLNTEKNSPYQDVVKAAAEFTGNWHPVHMAASAQLQTGSASHGTLGTTTEGVGLLGDFAGTGAQDFTGFGIGAQFGFDAIGGLTVGGSYTDLGRYNTIHGQNQAQDVFNVGAKYEFDKVGVALGYTTAEMYDNMLLTNVNGVGGANHANYVNSFNGYSAGATYTWFPGLSSNVDGTYFTQRTQDTVAHDDGFVVLLSQKLTF